MTWRERIAEAEGRRVKVWRFTLWPARFTRDDSAASVRTSRSIHPDGAPLCAAGEMEERYGIERYDADLWRLGEKFFHAVLYQRVREASRWLDAIEDRALELKREAGR